MIKKETKQSRKTAETRRKIIDVATRLMRTYGYEETSIRQICDESDISTGSFYHLFPSKQSLLDEIYGTVTPFYPPVNTEQMKKAPHLLVDQYVEGFSTMVYAVGPHVLFRAFFQAEDGNKILMKKDHPTMKFLYGNLSAAQEAGILTPELSLDEMSLQMRASMLGMFYSLYTEENLSEMKERLKALLYRLFDTYLAEPYASACTQTHV